MNDRQLRILAMLAGILGIAIIAVISTIVKPPTPENAMDGQRVEFTGNVLSIQHTKATTRMKVNTTCILDVTIFDPDVKSKGNIIVKGQMEGKWPSILADGISTVHQGRPS
ncbi:MAG: hypothetical protein ABIA93_07050 [Candidatus Woesearchaeota archaeon]